MTTIFLFPGQGSQKVGMGRDLFSSYPDVIQRANHLLGYSLSSLCLEGPASQLNQTQYTQPALFVVNALTYFKTMEGKKIKPDFLAGHSVGEYNALFAGGAFDFETGLTLVQKRGALMSQAPAGTMAAVIGLSQGKIREILKENNLETIDIANLNAPDQIVISGKKEDILKSQSSLEKSGGRYVLLNVGGAFHSRYMKEAEKEFKEFLSDFQFSSLHTPVLSNATVRPYSKDNIVDWLTEQISSPVRWEETIIHFLNHPHPEFYEIGPGSTLQGLLKKIKAHQEDLKKESVLISRNTKDSFSPLELGSPEFKKEHKTSYAYAAGAMVKGIASTELVIQMGKAGFLSFFGTGGLSLEEIQKAILTIQSGLKENQPYGFNLLSNLGDPDLEEATVDLFLKHKIQSIEASAYMQISQALVRYRLKGLSVFSNGVVHIPNKILAKVSRPEIATHFLSPPPENIVKNLLSQGLITSIEAELSRKIPMAEDICVESDSGGHTDKGVALVLIPAILSLKEEIQKKFGYSFSIRIGAAGGLGTPQAIAAAFLLGADFVLTGSINQSTVEAGTSEAVKDLLEKADIQDTAMAPAGDLFEMGSKVQVLKKGLFFPARASKLYDLYRLYNSWDEIDLSTRTQIEKNFFKKTFNEVFEETKKYYSLKNSQEIRKAEANPKHKMLLVFKWYFAHTNRLALNGEESSRVDFQIHCGPALGAFNRWVKGTTLESWRNRHAPSIAKLLMEEAALFLSKRFQEFNNEKK